jgi:hypothetical protein
VSQIITRTPAALAAELEANGPRATLSAVAWRCLSALMRAAEQPTDVDLFISHQELANRAGYLSRKSAQRGLGELTAAGLVEHRHGDRIGHGTTEVRVSRVRVWLEAVEALLPAGREFIERARHQSWSATQARMRELLDARKRARGRAVDNLAGTLEERLNADAPTRDPVHKRRSSVVDILSTSPPGPRPGTGRDRAPDPYVPETCDEHGGFLASRCKGCKQ